jgi:hypothetical protein
MTENVELKQKRNKNDIERITKEIDLNSEKAQNLLILEHAPEKEASRPNITEMKEDEKAVNCSDTDCSHHTAVLDNDESDSSWGLFDAKPRKSTQKKKRRNKKSAASEVTSPVQMTQEKVLAGSRHDTGTRTFQDSSDDSEWHKVSHQRKGRKISKSNINYTEHSFNDASNSKSKPTFCAYPVVVEDTLQTTSVCLKSVKWKLPDILHLAVGSVISIKQLSPTKVLVGCTDAHQQMRLVSLTSLGGIKVSNHVPVASTVGVISGIPLEISPEEVMRRIEFVRDSDDRIKQIPVRDVTRLKNRDGSPSLAFRFTFECTTLPSIVQINKTEFFVKPYSPAVLRCFKCQRLGHVAKSCPMKSSVCSTCGVAGHAANVCKSNKRYCVNCKSDSHSSAYGGCCKQKQWSVANKLRAQQFMPMATAFAQAKKLLAAKRQMDLPPVDAPMTSTPPNEAWKSEDRTTAPSYASVTASSRVKSKPTPATSHKQNISLNAGASVTSSPVCEGQSNPTGPPSPLPGRKDCCAELKSENALLRKQVSSLEEQLRGLSKSMSNLTEELSRLRQAAPQTSPVVSLPPTLPVDSSLQPSLIQAIENAILRIVPNLINRQMMYIPQPTHNG